MAGRARLAHMTHHYASPHLPSLTLRQTVLHRRRLLLRQLLCRRRQNAAAAVAHHRHVPVRRVQQTLVQQERRAVGDDRVTLHLAQTDAAVLLAALQRLARQLVDGARGAHLRLVGDLPVKNGGCPHHVSETLVVHNADVDVALCPQGDILIDFSLLHCDSSFGLFGSSRYLLLLYEDKP